MVFRPKHGRFIIDDSEVINDERTFETDFEGITREVFLVPIDDPDTGETELDIRRGDKFKILVHGEDGIVKPQQRFLELREIAEARAEFKLADYQVCEATTEVAKSGFHTLYPGLFPESQDDYDIDFELAVEFK